ncbi:hypothetical protein CEQ90_01835 [Lewinellaceae bacterium SD302]|nr:hypothetical protein CEQ90_01835 [Lewinellaceae bacterium SD302]
MRFTLLLAAISLLCSLSAQSPRPTGEIFDADLYNSLPLKAKVSTRAVLPPSVSLEKYCPTPGDQGEFMTCSAWSSAYHFRTIIEAKQRGLTDRASIDKLVYSPTWVYELLKQEGDDECFNGLATARSLLVFKELGVPSYADLPFACLSGSQEERFVTLDPLVEKAAAAKIRDLQILFKYGDAVEPEVKVRAIKKVLAEGYPVLVSHTLYNSFGKSKEVWKPETGEELADEHGSHAMVIVGYDDEKHGGAFRYLNSWGPNWGDGGFLWVPYSVTGNLCYGAYQAFPFPKTPKPAPAPTPVVNVSPSPAVPNVSPSPPPPAPVTASLPSGGMDFVTRLGSPMEVSRISTRGLIVENDTPTGSREMSAYRMRESYPSGTRFRFYLNTDVEGYVYAFASDLTGAVNQIFPYDEGVSPLIGGNSVIAFPADDKVIRMDNQPGTDYLLVLFSQQALNTKHLLAKMKATGGGLTAKVEAALGKALIGQDDIEYAPGRVGFSVREGAVGTVVPVMVEISHR